MLEMITELATIYVPILVGVGGILYGYMKRVSRAEWDDLVDQVEIITADDDISAEEFLSTMAKVAKAFRK